MALRKILLCMLIAVSTVISPGISQAAVNIDINIGPPAPQVEVVPAPRAGYIWAPGYWRWNGHQHVWVAGRWLHERHGRHWVQEQWVQRGHKWHFVSGHWAR